jgi:SAM-dependent methyltransferase
VNCEAHHTSRAARGGIGDILQTPRERAALCGRAAREFRGELPIARIAYYDRIARQWNRITGHHGGPFKRYVLNDRIIAHITGVEGRAILELGAGNGYFAPLLLRRFSGQRPARLLISDQSQAQLNIARAEFRVDSAEYLALDVQTAFPVPDCSFDLILAVMLFNELTASGMTNALRECRRTLRPSGQLLAAVTHPALVHALGRKDVLTDFGHGLAAMPGAEGLRLPVARRPAQAYLDALAASGFSVEADDVFADEKTFHARPGLKLPRDTPLALPLDCRAV